MENKNIEIERKFLVKLPKNESLVSDFFEKISSRKFKIKQGYLLTSKEKTVRIRTKGDKGYITIKSEANENGFSRFEWEKEITLSDAEQLFELCDEYIIDKTRYEVIFKGKTFEVDIFHGVHNGLTIAELELESEDESFEKPEWIGEEVTGDVRYYNAWLASPQNLPEMEAFKNLQN